MPKSATFQLIQWHSGSQNVAGLTRDTTQRI